MNGNRSRNLLLRLLCLGAFFAVTPLALLSRVQAQDAKPEAKAQTDTTPRSWTFAYKKGDVSKYRNQMALVLQQNGGDFKIDVKQLVKDEVKTTTDEGEGSIETIIESNEVTFGGQAVPNDPANNPIITRTVNKSGVIVKRELKNVQMGLEKLMDLTILILNTPAPAKPVKIGDSWKTDLDNPFIKDKKTTLTSTLVGVEKVAGIETLKIKTEYTLAVKADAPEKDAAKVTGSYNIDPKTGHLVRLVTNVDNMEITGPMGPVKLKLEQKTTLIVPGVNDKEDKNEKESGEKK